VRKNAEDNRHKVEFFPQNLPMDGWIDHTCVPRAKKSQHRSIKLSTYGVMFMGTPHQGGSGVGFGRLMINVVASVFVAIDDRPLRNLERDLESLQQQLRQHAPISGDFVTKFAFEKYTTLIVLGRSMVVYFGQAGARKL
jgi:hypothetical protein